MYKANIFLPAGGGYNSPKTIVIHAMAEMVGPVDGVYYFATDWLKRKKLSAHRFITPSGIVIAGHPDDRIAWHAKGYNTDTLGVEFLVPGVFLYDSFKKEIQEQYITGAQYLSGVGVVRELIRKYSIRDVVQHSAIDPHRKVDPGTGFPWRKFLEDIGI